MPTGSRSDRAISRSRPIWPSADSCRASCTWRRSPDTGGIVDGIFRQESPGHRRNPRDRAGRRRGVPRGGARVAVNGRSPGSVAGALASLGAGAAAVAAPGDLGTVEGCRRVVAGAVDALGGLDVLVNNAGVSNGGLRFEETTEADWEAVVGIDLRAVFFCTRFAVPALRAAQGNVVNIASVLGLGGRGIGVSLYCTAKGGVVNLTRDLAIELAPEIRVNCICPGTVDTEMLRATAARLSGGDPVAGFALMTRDRPVKRVATPAEIAGPVLYLASGLAGFVTGSIHTVDGGVTAKVG
ncbi:MAG: SDR family oxidoreductase [Dongiaceae bacterium]